MRGRALWVEMFLVLLALLFVELGAVLRELRTDVIYDWFVSLAPLIWIDLSVLVLEEGFQNADTHARHSPRGFLRGSHAKGYPAAPAFHARCSSLTNSSAAGL